ncbi:MAG: hypothetical protein KatS3mg054_0165 [Chloroflexus sp.]|nr:MAG: hypothetical protein KatS3mg054_0165 [Chloroflexus sp.]
MPVACRFSSALPAQRPHHTHPPGSRYSSPPAHKPPAHKPHAYAPTYPRPVPAHIPTHPHAPRPASPPHPTHAHIIPSTSPPASALLQLPPPAPHTSIRPAAAPPARTPHQHPAPTPTQHQHLRPQSAASRGGGHCATPHPYGHHPASPKLRYSTRHNTPSIPAPRAPPSPPCPPAPHTPPYTPIHPHTPPYTPIHLLRHHPPHAKHCASTAMQPRLRYPAQYSLPYGSTHMAHIWLIWLIWL